ncbi:MAG: RNA methyltransferase, partial [Bacteroidales bacterium]|nr:RNA methyltransferase [Bacteroidales bacterium]
MSISKNELRQVRALAKKKFRDETGLFVVEGEKMVAEAVKSGFEVVSVYRRDDIGEETMARLSFLSSPSPVLAVVRQP